MKRTTLPHSHYMSIAVAAIVKPSRHLFVALGGMSALAVLVGLAIGIGWIGELSYVVRVSLCLACVFLAFLGFYHGSRYRKPIHIDISGAGLLHIVEMSPVESCAGKKRPHLKDDGKAFRLLGTSTIWPCLLLLHLRTESGKVRILPIFPDSVSQDDFRALSAACLWIAQHDRSSSCENS